MGRRTVAFTEDSISRAIRGVRKAGVEIKTIRVNQDGSVVIIGDGDKAPAEFEVPVDGYL